MHNNRYYEIDIYPFSKTTAICEIELTRADEHFELPEFIHLITEVTGDKRYSNFALAKKIPTDLM